MTRATAGRDDEEAAADVALAGDDVTRRELDLDGDGGDPGHPGGVHAVEQPRGRQQLRPSVVRVSAIRASDA